MRAPSAVRLSHTSTPSASNHTHTNTSEHTYTHTRAHTHARHHYSARHRYCASSVNSLHTHHCFNRRKRNRHCDISLNQSPDSLKCADRRTTSEYVQYSRAAGSITISLTLALVVFKLTEEIKAYPCLLMIPSLCPGQRQKHQSPQLRTDS